VQFQRVPSLLILFLTAQIACTTVHVPPDEPLTETALAEAMALLHATDERVEVLEGGLQLEVYVYEWRPLPRSAGLGLHESLLNESMFPEGREMRVLVGPRRSLYLPYASIGTIAARSWPLWAGVEIEVLEAGAKDLAGPVVIRAADAEEAARLSDAIECARRARLFSLDPAGTGVSLD
jgi:hypothetical protein